MKYDALVPDLTMGASITPSLKSSDLRGGRSILRRLAVGSPIELEEADRRGIFVVVILLNHTRTVLRIIDNERLETSQP